MLSKTSRDIEEIRETVHNFLSVDVFGSRGGGDFKSLKGYDIKEAFRHYDKLLFDDQIQGKIDLMGKSLRFFSASRTTGVVGMCGKKGSTQEYYIDVAPNLIAQLSRRHSRDVEKLFGEGKSDRVYCLQLVIEHEIVHLLMILWGYLYKETQGPRASYYSSHGKLFQLLLRTYFKHTNHVENLTSVDIVVPRQMPFRPVGSVSPGLPVNWTGSCYMDSLIVALLAGANNFYRENILEDDPQTIEYFEWTDDDLEKSPALRGEKVFIAPCHPNSGINTDDIAKVYASKLQEAFRGVQSRIESGANFHAVDLRKILAEGLPSLLPYRDYNVSEVYEVLTGIFPKLKLRDIPASITNPVLGTTRSGVVWPKAVFQMWDYMDPDSEGKIPKWGKVNSSVLVFQNGLVPSISDYSSTNPEKIQVHGPIPGRYVRTEREVNGEMVEAIVPEFGSYVVTQEKARSFGEYIVDGRYRLFAAVIIRGPRPQTLSGWGGGHYTTYIRPKGDEERWYHYDDMGPCWYLANREGTLPDSVFHDLHFERPELLFYEKIKDSDVDTSIVPQSEKWKGRSLEVKIIRGSIVFVRDLSTERIHVPHLESLDPTTRITDRTFMWRSSPEKIGDFLTAIQEMDRLVDETRDTSIENVSYGTKFRDLGDSGLAVYNYSPTGFVVWGEPEILNDQKIIQSLRHLGGAPNSHLKNGLEGGYVFSKHRHLESVLGMWIN